MTTHQLDFKAIIVGGFIRNGIKCLTYCIVFLFITIGFGYGGNVLAQSEVNTVWVQYVAWGGVFVFGTLAFKLLYDATRHFIDLRRFMFNADTAFCQTSKGKQLSVDRVLENMKDEKIVYVNKNVVITSNYFIILKHDPTIYQHKHLQAAYKESSDLHEVERGKKYENKIINLKFNKNHKVVYCSSVDEANELLEVVEEIGKVVYPGRDSYKRSLTV